MKGRVSQSSGPTLDKDRPNQLQNPRGEDGRHLTAPSRSLPSTSPTPNPPPLQTVSYSAVDVSKRTLKVTSQLLT